MVVHKCEDRATQVSRGAGGAIPPSGR